MESKAHLRFLRMSPRKVSTVAALVRGKSVGQALNILRFTSRAAPTACIHRSSCPSGTPCFLKSWKV